MPTNGDMKPNESPLRKLPRRATRSLYVEERDPGSDDESPPSKRLRTASSEDVVVLKTPPPASFNNLPTTPNVITTLSLKEPPWGHFPATPSTPIGKLATISMNDVKVQQAIEKLKQILEIDADANDTMWTKAAAKDWIAAEDAHGEQAAMNQRRKVVNTQLQMVTKSFLQHERLLSWARGLLVTAKGQIDDMQDQVGTLETTVAELQTTVKQAKRRLEQEVEQRKAFEVKMQKLEKQQKGSGSYLNEYRERRKLEREVTALKEALTTRDVAGIPVGLSGQGDSEKRTDNESVEAVGGTADAGERIWLQGEVERLKKEIRRLIEGR